MGEIHKICADSLLSLLIGCILVVESTGVLHGDRIALLCLVGAIAGADHRLGDTHIDWYMRLSWSRVGSGFDGLLLFNQCEVGEGKREKRWMS